MSELYTLSLVIVPITFIIVTSVFLLTENLNELCKWLFKFRKLLTFNILIGNITYIHTIILYTTLHTQRYHTQDIIWVRNVK